MGIIRKVAQVSEGSKGVVVKPPAFMKKDSSEDDEARKVRLIEKFRSAAAASSGQMECKWCEMGSCWNHPAGAGMKGKGEDAWTYAGAEGCKWCAQGECWDHGGKGMKGMKGKLAMHGIRDVRDVRSDMGGDMVPPFGEMRAGGMGGAVLPPFGEMSRSSPMMPAESFESLRERSRSIAASGAGGGGTGSRGPGMSGAGMKSGEGMGGLSDMKVPGLTPLQAAQARLGFGTVVPAAGESAADSVARQVLLAMTGKGAKGE